MSTETNRHGRTAFSLIELLIVLSIIALLISLLLPAIASSRRTAHSVACQAKLRAIGEAFTSYSIDFDDWIVGSPAGSGAYITGTVASGPCTQRWDFLGPIAKIMGIPLPEDRGDASTIARFHLLRSMEQFHCPANRTLASRYDGPDAGVGPMVSYNTSRYMLFRYDSRTSNGLDKYKNDQEEKLPRGWAPKLRRMGNLSKKVFCADGARFSTTTIPPDYDLRAQADWGGAFSDTAPYSSWSRAWDRSGRTGSTFDARVYAFRHSSGASPSKAPGNAFKLNLLFMDGHAERMGDLEAANPWMWLPTGSKLVSSSMYQDVRQHFGVRGTINIGN